MAERLRILAALIEDPSLEWVTVGMLVHFRCPRCGASLQPVFFIPLAAYDAPFCLWSESLN